MELFRRKFSNSFFKHVDNDAYVSAVSAGLASRPPCRYEIFTIRPDIKNHAPVVALDAPGCSSALNIKNEDICVLFDIAHNEAGIHTLMEKVKHDFGDTSNIRLVSAFSSILSYAKN